MHWYPCILLSRYTLILSDLLRNTALPSSSQARRPQGKLTHELEIVHTIHRLPNFGVNTWFCGWNNHINIKWLFLAQPSELKAWYTTFALQLTESLWINILVRYKALKSLWKTWMKNCIFCHEKLKAIPTFHKMHFTWTWILYILCIDYKSFCTKISFFFSFSQEANSYNGTLVGSRARNAIQISHVGVNDPTIWAWRITRCTQYQPPEIQMQHVPESRHFCMGCGCLSWHPNHYPNHLPLCLHFN